MHIGCFQLYDNLKKPKLGRQSEYLWLQGISGGRRDGQIGDSQQHQKLELDF